MREFEEETLLLCCKGPKCPQITVKNDVFLLEDEELGIVGDRAIKLDREQAELLHVFLSKRLAK